MVMTVNGLTNKLMEAATTTPGLQERRDGGFPCSALLPVIVVAYGGGVNSTAMLVEMHKRGIMPGVILFSDTGGERPETYAAVQTVSDWCVAHGMPAIATCKHHGGREIGDESLEAECLRLKRLPSIAYGFKSCSEKWKQRPFEAWLKANGVTNYRKAVGFDAGEERRMNADERNWYPLIEWGLWREDCETICIGEGLPAAKSSCFFCPSMKKHEVLSLGREHPDLAARAVAMESNAELTTNKGLGRSWAWSDLMKADDDQLKLFSDAGAPEIPCGCYDG